MNTKKYISLIITLAVVGILSLTAPVLADNQQDNNGQRDQEQEPAIVGTVSAINGDTITVAGKQDSEETNATATFTVNTTNAVITKNGVTITVSGIAIGDTIVVKGTVTGTNVVATTIRAGQSKNDETDSNRMRPNVVGKVSAINENILTVISKQTTFTVDATNAKLLRGNTTITLSNIAIGDTIVAQGTITGNNIVATIIRDGKVGNGNNDDNNALLQIQGDGQPIVAGTISVIDGSTLTIANSNVTYTVNAANATIVQGKNKILLSGLKVGDSVIIQGTVNGTSITASTIIDQANSTREVKRLGFFSSIGQWFRRLFRF